MLGRRYLVECEFSLWGTTSTLLNVFLLKSIQRIAKRHLCPVPGLPAVTNTAGELFIVAMIAIYRRKQRSVMKINIIVYDSPLQLVKMTVRRMLCLHFHPVLSASSFAPSWGNLLTVDLKER